MKLKYILLSILFPAMTILFASCFDDLNTTPLDPKLYTADKAYSTPESYMQGLANCMQHLASPDKADQPVRKLLMWMPEPLHSYVHSGTCRSSLQTR